MRYLLIAVAIFFAMGIVFAEEIESGLKAGSKVPAFHVTKIGGPQDGVKTGQSLCYRCRYGASPTTIIFVRKIDGSLANLVGQIDNVAKNSAMKAFVVFLGAENEAAAANFAKANPTKAVPYTVAKDHKAVAAKFKLNDNAGCTVLMYKNNKDGVVVNRAMKSVTDDDAGALTKDTAKILG